MRIDAHINRKLATYAVVLLVLLIIAVSAAVSAGVALISQPKARYTCASFGSYGAAYTAFKNGATYLDGDKDGIPCDALYNKSKHL